MSPLIVDSPPPYQGGHALIRDLALEGADGQYVPLLLPGRRHVSEIEGLIGLSARERVRARPSRRGVLNTTRYTDSPPIVVKGELFGDTPDDAWDEYNALAAACASAIDTDRSLRWSGGTLLDLVETRVRVSELAPPITVAEDVIRYQLTLRPSDPASYSQNEVVVDSTKLSASGGGKQYPYHYPRGYAPAGGGSADFTVGGTTATPPILEIHGFASGASLVLASTGAVVRINGSVDPGRFLVIDVDKRQVRLDDGTIRNSLFDFEAGAWFDLPPGPQSVQMFASSFDSNAFLRVRYRPAYA